MFKFYARRTAFMVFFAAVAWTFFYQPVLAEGDFRNPDWGTPLSVEGLPNLHKVTETLYRSAQPTAAGLRNAESLGINTVLNLRGFHNDDELAESTKLTLVRVKIDTWDMDEENILAALRVILQAEGPILVHCQHGADRTGTVIAAYRMVVQDWPREAAIAEMTEGGYGFHSTWGNLINLLENLDVDKMRAQLRSEGYL